MNDLERVGGRPGLERIFGDLLTRMRSDFVIGFLFQDKDISRIIKHEVEHAEAILVGGGAALYTGQPLPEIHRPLRLNRGQFRRRMAFLKTVLLAHSVPNDIIERWIASDNKLERVLTDGSDCVVS